MDWRYCGEVNTRIPRKSAVNFIWNGEKMNFLSKAENYIPNYNAKWLTCALGMDHSFWDTLSIKVCEFIQESNILQQQGSPRPHSQTGPTVIDWCSMSSNNLCFLSLQHGKYLIKVTSNTSLQFNYLKLCSLSTKTVEVSQMRYPWKACPLSLKDNASSGCRMIQPPDMEDSCEYIQYAIVDSWKEVVIQSGGWAKG